tara:strand:- start:238 stop:600 length:363 start_codon:yes stop_codon:yes gene_type:complete
MDLELRRSGESQVSGEKPKLEILAEKAVTDFFTGFFLHCCISIPTAILGFFLGFIGLFGNPDSTLVLWPVILILCLFYPTKLVGDKKHVRLFGSIVSIPACMFVVLMGITFGIFLRFGIF